MSLLDAKAVRDVSPRCFAGSGDLAHLALLLTAACGPSKKKQAGIGKEERDETRRDEKEVASEQGRQKQQNRKRRVSSHEETQQPVFMRMLPYVFARAAKSARHILSGTAQRQRQCLMTWRTQVQETTSTFTDNSNAVQGWIFPYIIYSALDT